MSLDVDHSYVCIGEIELKTVKPFRVFGEFRFCGH